MELLLDNKKKKYIQKLFRFSSTHPAANYVSFTGSTLWRRDDERMVYHQWENGSDLKQEHNWNYDLANWEPFWEATHAVLGENGVITVTTKEGDTKEILPAPVALSPHSLHGVRTVEYSGKCTLSSLFMVRVLAIFQRKLFTQQKEEKEAVVVLDLSQKRMYLAHDPEDNMLLEGEVERPGSDPVLLYPFGALKEALGSSNRFNKTLTCYTHSSYWTKFQYSDSLATVLTHKRKN